MRQRSWYLLLAFLVSFFLLSSVSQPRVTAHATSQQGDPDQELDQARVWMRQGKYDDALKAFKRANAQRGNNCVECLWGIAQAYQKLEAHKNAITTCDQILALTGNDAGQSARAHNMKALSLLSLAGYKDQKKLQEAEAELRKALEADDSLRVARFNLGVALLRLHQDADGIGELRRFVEDEENGPQVEEARRLVDNPRRAREDFAPDFSFSTMQGDYLDSEELRGKVVLLDFWGTWCPPCVESVPDMRLVWKKFSKEPFVMISVSSDRDESLWREFVEKNKMEWPQYLDRDAKVQRSFQVRAFPTYILLDHEGIIQMNSVGLTWSRAAGIEEAIRKAVKTAKETAKHER